MTVARKDFPDPPLRYKSRPLWFWNTNLSKTQTLRVMTKAKENGYYGLGIVPSYGMSPGYMSLGFLEQYKYALEVADSLDMKMCLYDEFYFPSGMAGGNLMKDYPEAVSKRLDKEEYLFKGPGVFSQTLTFGHFMGAVAMELSSLERIDLSENMKENILNASLPEGEWRVMIFLLNSDNSTGRNHVDYLDPSAVERFIELTYDKFYNAFPEHFGTTIDFAFYDEPCMRWVEEGRTWTGSYNNRFMEEYGFSPVEYYPALWYNIGKKTMAARNMLYGFRAELFASGFAGTINRWCNEHNIQLTGHVDQEEVLNPVSICGDLIKSFKYQDIPGVDQIAHYGRASKIYKVVSSAALNYDRPLVASETYGAIRNMPPENLFKEAMDQFAKGINLMEPHAVWYDKKIDIPPDLSPTSAKYSQYFDNYNKYIGRLQLIMQGGQHIADIAVLYPIASLQAAYSFKPGDPGLGGKTSSEADYLDIGEMLALDIRMDYTFIHPEVLDEKCILENSYIKLQNNSEFSKYNIIILPGSKTIKWSNLQKIKRFYENGGIVIATSVLPEFSAEFGLDNDVQAAIKEIFGYEALNMTGLSRVSASSIWNTGGFLPAYAIDGNQETSWRPSRGNPADEWIEVEFGKEIKTGHIEITGEESLEYSFGKGWSATDKDQPFFLRLFVQTEKGWIETGIWKNESKNKSVFFEPQNISGMRVVILSGQTDKVSIPEILIFDQMGNKIDIAPKSYFTNNNVNGGKSFFTPAPNAELIRNIMNDASEIWDIRTEHYDKLSNGNLSCIHKKMDGKDIYFFANSSDNELKLPVLLRGKMSLNKWDPHSGLIEKYPSTTIHKNGYDLTSLQFSLGPVKSVFFVTN
ncbi:glycosyl hydrolase [Bacteroidota bacterium]